MASAEPQLSPRNHSSSPFTVSYANRPTTAHLHDRDDLDMLEQRMMAQMDGRSAVHAVNCRHYKTTCSSRTMHKEFITLLLVEADWYHFGNEGEERLVSGGVEARRRFREELVQLETEAYEMMTSPEKYAKALAFIASHRLFHWQDAFNHASTTARSAEEQERPSGEKEIAEAWSEVETQLNEGSNHIVT